MPAVSELLKQRWETASAEAAAYLHPIEQRIAEGGDAMSEDEKVEARRLATNAQERQADYEAQRDLEGMLPEGPKEDPKDVQREMEDAHVAAGAQREGLQRAVRDVFGADDLEDYNQRSGRTLRDFAVMAAEGRSTSLKLRLNPQAARNFRELQSMGVDPRDYVSAVREGNKMIATRNADGVKDVRLYQMGTDTNIIPTYWDDMLYLFASYIGGVQNAGADVIPVTGNNTLKLPKITAYHATGMSPVKEGVAATNEVQDTVGSISLTPRPFRGFSAETDELMRSAIIDTRLMLVLRGLARAMQLGKEAQFHNGSGAANFQCLGILDTTSGATAARIHRLSKVNSQIGYADMPIALSMLDTEYHAGMRPGAVVSLMHSAIWFKDFVAALATDGHPIYPNLATSPLPPGMFGTRVVYDSVLPSSPSANKCLTIIGNFQDAYVIATMGGSEIEVSDDLRFLEWERVYRMQEYCDGTIRDNLALTYIFTKAS